MARDITGERFGRLIAIEPTDRRDSNQSVVWLCKCDCGNYAHISRSSLITGNTKSCGCLNTGQRSDRIKDIRGQKFGRLTAVEPTDRRGPSRSVIWLCECDCGNIKYVNANALQSGAIRSCGCLYNESRTETKWLKHGDARKNRTDRLYNTWTHMKSRCNNPNDSRYDRYGGRGISVCEAWNDYEPFRNWALAHGYSEELTIERTDNDGNYEPDNCIWADNITQCNNRSSCRYLEYDGETHTISEWSKIIGMDYFTLRKRIDSGWSIEDALFKPIRHIKQKEN